MMWVCPTYEWMVWCKTVFVRFCAPFPGNGMRLEAPG